MTHGKTNINVAEISYNPYEQLVNYTMLYDSGDECTDITGGWGVDSVVFSAEVEIGRAHV